MTTATSSEWSEPLAGWFALQYTTLMLGPGGGLTIAAAAAPPETLFWLSATLVLGSLLIFPARGHLFWVMTREQW